LRLWFTEAFEGPCRTRRFVAGEIRTWSAGRDTIKTMALVEACYQPSDRAGHRPGESLTSHPRYETGMSRRAPALWHYDPVAYGWIDG
jgi:hypothetical protein